MSAAPSAMLWRMTIVVGYVPSPEGEAALTAAVAEARRRQDALHVLNTAREDSLGDSRFLPEPAVEALRARLDDAGIGYEIEQLVRGKEAAEEIVDAADRLSADLIVIGLRRRSPTGKLITGSQAQRVLLDANCPVLAVKAH
jgi:nucleotide-binding universal stress UspA family protein